MKLYGQPVRSFSLLLAVCIVFIFFSRDFRVGESNNRNNTVYSIRFQYFGIDAREMERLITIPFEESIATIPSLYEMRSVSEYSLSETTVFFPKDVDEKTVYLEIRDAVDTLFSTLPSAVQKPRIFSSSSDQYPMLSISAYSASVEINELRQYVEKTLKKEFEAVDGVSEVIVTGGSVEEIKVEFDSGRAIVGKVNPDVIGNIIRDANVINPGGIINHPDRNDNLYFDTRIGSIKEMEELPVVAGKGITKLSYLATIRKTGRGRDEIVRIDGKECIVLSIKNSSDGSKTSVSDTCRKILEGENDERIQYTVLYDDGAAAKTLIHQIALALIQSFFLVIVLLPLFFGSMRSVGLAIVLLPLSMLMTVGMLNRIGMTVDQNALAGMSIALGLIIDPALVIISLREAGKDRIAFNTGLVALVPSIISSTVTTLLVLIPLYFLEYLVPGIRSIVLSIALMVGGSLLVALVFLPCFIDYSGRKPFKVVKRVNEVVNRFFIRMMYHVSIPILRRPKLAMGIYFFLLTLPFVIFAISGKNISIQVSNDILPVFVEFESERAADAIDVALEELVVNVQGLDGVLFVRTEAKKGVMDISVKFKKDIVTRKELASRVNALSGYSRGGFLYVPDLAEKKRKMSTEISVAISGDETELCRTLAQTASKALSSHSSVEQVVLNFKEPERVVLFSPDKDFLVKTGMTVSDVANTLRWMLFGPVVDKWIQEGTEMDIRVSGMNMKSLHVDDFRNLVIPAKNGGLRLGAIGTVTELMSAGKIYRKDGRRAAYLTVHVGSGSTDEAILIVREALTEVDLPKGYGFSLTRELDRMKDQYMLLIFAFAASITGVLILLTALTENPSKSLLIVTIIPVSIALPMLIRLITGEPLSMGDIVAMVILSGINVNNAIYISESHCLRMIARIRKKLQPILIASLTTIAGALPLLIFGKDDFSRSLAFFMFWGILGSLLVSITLFPAVLSMFEKKIDFNEES